MDDNDYDVLFKVLFLIFVVALFLILPAVFGSKSEADYSTGDTRATASSSQKLTLIILPALEHTVLATERVDRETTSYLLGIRANTPWTLDYRIESPDSVYEPTCSASRTSGPSNDDEGFQFVQITCRSPWSWADEPVLEQTLRYSISPSFRG